jgi:fibronectin type 3 domain-containing protein
MLASMAFVWGCSGVITANTAGTPPPPPPPQTYSISGTITPAAGGSGATVTLGGVAAATKTADSSGNYTFTGLSNGAYAVTPSQTGYAFTPTTQSVTVSGANVSSVNFTATAQQAHSVALSWNPSTSTVSGYNIYRSSVSGGGYAKLNSLLVGTLAFTDSTVQSGGTYYYVTTAVDAGGVESTISNEVSAAIP